MIRLFRFALYLVSFLLAPSAWSQDNGIKRLDPRLDALVPANSRLETIAEGFAWLEGPICHRQGSYLLFTDIPDNAVHKWQAGEGSSLFLEPCGYTGEKPFAGREPGANGLTLDSNGRLVLCQHGDRSIARLEDDGQFIVLASHYQGKRLNSPNDLVYKSDSSLHFTDPPFGLPENFNDPAKELDFQGLYRLAPDGTLTLLTRELKAPNGIAFSPGERRLYVADVDFDRPAWWVFEVRDDGTLAKGRIFYHVGPWMQDRPGGPDGLKVDRSGNLFAAGPGGVFLFAPDGTLLGIIETGVATSNVAFGEQGQTLFVTASTKVLRIPLATRGQGFMP